MAQHDYNLSNNTGVLYRADNNAALQAIVTQNSGTSAPTVTFPGMLWLDLSGGGDGVMRRRNQANNAWLNDIGIDQTARDAAAAAQTTANNAMPKAGGTFTGPINLPGTVPTNNNAVSRAQGDALYQVRLPATQAGALLYGSASAWDQVLAPAANGTLLSLSGGLPTWSTPATAAAPNSIVRTGADGFIDPSFIPSVASGLRFRGTFKPAVNAEYPTTGGSGAGGAPAVGDFWVIDGLTTGGYTYLTGPLAGVTVYNGDSIARSDTSWYRMGSSVQLDGYMRVDGSTAMTGDLNLGTHNLVAVGGITARAGSPVPLQNFSIDASNVVVSPQRGTTGAALAPMATGQIGTDLGNSQLWVGASGVNVPLIAVPYFSATAAYSIGQYVVNGGVQYRARAAIAAGAFTPSQWDQVIDASGATFRGAVTSLGNFTVQAAAEMRFSSAAGVTRARVYLDGSSNLAFGGYDSAGANPVGFMAFDYALNRVVASRMYIDTLLTSNTTITMRIGASVNTMIFSVDLNMAAFYVTGNAGELAFNTLTDAGGYAATPMRLLRGTGNNYGVSMRGQQRIWGYGTDNAGVIRWGAADTAYQYFDGTAMQFSMPCSAPAFTPCDKQLKENIIERTPRNYDWLKFYEFDRIDTDRHERGIVADDLVGKADDMLLEITDPDGRVLRSVNLANLALEIAMNVRERVRVLEATQET